MKLNVGMYIITNDRMRIGKIKDFCYCDMCKERGFYEPIIDNPDIIITNYDKERKFHGYKFYNNLTDLLRKKDIILGTDGKIYEVKKVWKDYVFTTTKTKEGLIKTLVDYQIDKIITREQFEKNSYEV